MNQTKKKTKPIGRMAKARKINQRRTATMVARGIKRRKAQGKR